MSIPLIIRLSPSYSAPKGPAFGRYDGRERRIRGMEVIIIYWSEATRASDVRSETVPGHDRRE